MKRFHRSPKQFAGGFSVFLAVFALLVSTPGYSAGLKLRDICRIKGQEKNTLHGLGLVVGLSGTGDSDMIPTKRHLAQFMRLLGAPVGLDANGQPDLGDVADADNVALVIVTANIPTTGAQAGDAIDITVNSLAASSLVGGTLMLTPMLGPLRESPIVYATAQGKLSVASDGPLTSATIQGGAKMEESVLAKFQKNGRITLVIEKDFASFDTAQKIQDEINNVDTLTQSDFSEPGRPSGRDWARAIDQAHVEVQIPDIYRDNPIKFITEVLRTTIQINSHSNRVVINEREGVVVIGKDVEIAPGLVSYRNLRIEAGGGGGFVEVNDGTDERANAKLKSLADALNALDVPTEDLIAIIRTLKGKGDLFGEVVFQ